MKEAALYTIVAERLMRHFVDAGSNTVRVEVTAAGFPEKIKEAIPEHRNIIFSFLKSSRPDITGVISDNNGGHHLMVAEIKTSPLELKDVYQTKRYKDLLCAPYAFLISTQEIPIALKRVCSLNPPAMLSSVGDPFGFLALARFFDNAREFHDWFPQNYFADEHRWTSLKRG
jgi:hypothetical protein